MLVLIRGAGDIASGIALRLYRCGFSVAMTETAYPTAIRRTVAFSEAVNNRQTTVEGVKARRAYSVTQARELMYMGVIPVLVDEECACREELRPDALVDAILAKKNLGTAMADAPVVIGVGPGFRAGIDCHAVIETMRGHTLGRVIYWGSALPNTGVPGQIGGQSAKRVLRAPADGVFQAVRRIGDRVEAGEAVGVAGGVPMAANIGGVLRGLLADRTPVYRGMKAGDVDPRGNPCYCNLVSDKALAVAGGVLEAILHFRG